MSQEVDEVLEDTNLNLVPLLRHFEDQRQFPRVDLRTDVVVRTSDEKVLRARMRNLSAEGMQIRCDPVTARALHPTGTQIVASGGPRVMARFELETAQGRSAFAVESQLRYIAAKSPKIIAFGLKFTRVSLDVKKRLSDYLIDCMRPAV